MYYLHFTGCVDFSWQHVNWAINILLTKAGPRMHCIDRGSVQESWSFVLLPASGYMTSPEGNVSQMDAQRKQSFLPNLTTDCFRCGFWHFRLVYEASLTLLYMTWALIITRVLSDKIHCKSCSLESCSGIRALVVNRFPNKSSAIYTESWEICLNLTPPRCVDPVVHFACKNVFSCQIFPEPSQLVNDTSIKICAHPNSLLRATNILV